MGKFLRLYIVDFTFRISYNIARAPLLPLFVILLGGNEKDVGVIVAASTITGLILKLPAGIFSDVFGSRPTMLVGLTVAASAPYFYTFIQGLQPLLLLRYYHGLATAIFAPAAMATVAVMAGERKGEMLSYLGIIKIATKALAGLLVTALLALLIPANINALEFMGLDSPINAYQEIYLVSGVFAIISFAIAFFFLKDIDPKLPTTTPKKNLAREIEAGIDTIRTNFKLILTCSVEGVQNLSMGILETFLVIYVTKEAHLPVWQAGILWVILTGVSFFVKPVMGRISDRYGRQSIIYTGMLLCAMPFAAIPAVKGFWVLCTLSIIYGFGEAFVTSSTSALSAEFVPKERAGAAMGIFGLLSDFGQAIGPLICGAMIPSFGYSTAFGFFAIVMLAVTMLFEIKISPKPNSSNP